MSWEHAYDSQGEEIDSEGVPYKEQFSSAEIRRLGFMVYQVTQQESELAATDMLPDFDFQGVPPALPEPTVQHKLPPLVQAEPEKWRKIRGIWYRQG